MKPLQNNPESVQPQENIPAYKRVFVGWLAIYPIITLLIYGLDGFIGGLPLYIQTFIVTLIAVPLMSYIVMPLFNRLFFNSRH